MNKVIETPLLGKIDDMVDSVLEAQQRLRFADFFCGIGGFHIGATNLGMECVFASDIDQHAQDTYEANFGIRPAGDIYSIQQDDVPDHDLLFAGFPCQPFSIIGK